MTELNPGLVQQSNRKLRETIADRLVENDFLVVSPRGNPGPIEAVVDDVVIRCGSGAWELRIGESDLARHASHFMITMGPRELPLIACYFRSQPIQPEIIHAMNVDFPLPELLGMGGTILALRADRTEIYARDGHILVTYSDQNYGMIAIDGHDITSRVSRVMVMLIQAKKEINIS